MNRANEIIEFLSQPGQADVLILAPNAPPVSRSGGKVDVAITSVFDAQDVNDTLAAFRTRALASSAEAALVSSGSFSFGVRNVGRFRINYATQRGSRVLCIMRIPASPPRLPDLCEDAAIQEQALSLLRAGGPGILAVCGPSAVSNALFCYALIEAMNQAEHKVLYVLERALTFLIRHENSVVIQCEVGADVKSMDEGVNVASLFEPDIMFIGDVKPGDDLEGINRAVENGVMVLLSSVMLNPQALCNRYLPRNRHFGEIDDIAAHGFRVTHTASSKLAATFMGTIRRNNAE